MQRIENHNSHSSDHGWKMSMNEFMDVHINEFRQTVCNETKKVSEILGKFIYG